MWGIRILTGPQAGQTLPLKPGRNVLGRAPHCDIKILSAGVSKEHSEITVFPDRVTVTDLKSSNGTYINGIKVQTGQIRLGDKVSAHDVIFDLIAVSQQSESVRAPAPAAPRPQPVAPQMGYGMPPNSSVPYPPQYPSGYPTGVLQNPAAAEGMAHLAPPSAAFTPPQNFFEQLHAKFNEYMERVALPAIYKVAEWLDLKYILLSFVIIFIFMTTLLSMIPMVTITKESIMAESMRRAKSLARSVATLNQGALLQGNITGLSTYTVEAEEGVTQVLIIDQRDGSILAPASRAGVTADLPFVHVARQESRAMTAQIDSTTIGASFPIGAFDPNTGEQSVKAHAVVLYDISALDFDTGRALSLFLQTLVISSVLGMILFYFLYALIEHPFKALNAELDTALREKRDTTTVKFMFAPLQALISNVNSLLNRYISGDSSNGGAMINRDGEAENLVNMIGFPAMCLSADGRIMAANGGFLQVARTESLAGMQLAQIPDSALQQNIQFLIQKSQENLRMIHTDHLEFSGHMCTLSCQAMASNGQTVDYYIFTVAPNEGSGG